MSANMFDDVASGRAWNFQPNTSAVQFGSSANVAGAAMAEAGTLFRQVSAGISPAATAADNVLAVYTLPANCFDVAGRGIYLAANGAFAANANAKRVKILAGCTAAVVGSTVSGGTVIADSGALTTTTAAGWSLAGELYKYGNAGSNTQEAIHQAAQWGSTVLSLLAPQGLTLVENAPIIFAVTGNAGTTASDIVLNLFLVEGFN